MYAPRPHQPTSRRALSNRIKLQDWLESGYQCMACDDAGDEWYPTERGLKIVDAIRCGFVGKLRNVAKYDLAR